MSTPVRSWPSFSGLGMDLLDQGREQAGLPAVPVGLDYDASVDQLPRYLVSVVDPQAGRLEAGVIMDVESLATTFREAENLAFEADDIMMGYPLSISSGGRVVLVDRVGVVASPAVLNMEGETKIRRFLATYQLVVRRG